MAMTPNAGTKHAMEEQNREHCFKNVLWPSEIGTAMTVHKPDQERLMNVCQKEN